MINPTNLPPSDRLEAVSIDSRLNGLDDSFLESKSTDLRHGVRRNLTLKNFRMAENDGNGRNEQEAEVNWSDLVHGA